MKSVSVVIVTYNSEAELGECLDAVQEFGQVIVVDNASTDGGVAVAASRPWVEIAANPTNRGFAAAVNQGARMSHGRHLLVLNPDAVIVSDCRALVEASERTGVAAGRLVDASGRTQEGFTVRRLPTPTALVFECLGLNRLWPSNPVNARYRCRDLDLSRPCPVEQPAGAFLMIRRDVFDKLGGFDEAFWPVWYEDVDWCKRAAEAGYTIEFVPSAKARHAGGHSVGKLDRERQRLYWYGSLLRYTGKHCSRNAFRAVAGSVFAGSLLRTASGMLNPKGDGEELTGDFKKVLKLAAASFFAGSYVCPAAAGDGTDGRRRLKSHPVDGR
ncbi:MAG: glycosyltransferase family 2 protein [Acidobacteria bacterium]|nr:glycosyltransferase family 2 protein [Acidobacteriota bacterium]